LLSAACGGTSSDFTESPPTQERLYTTTFQSGDVSGFDIDIHFDSNRGMLRPIAGAPFPALSQPSALTVTPDHTHLYVGSGNHLESFAVDQVSGGLTPLGDSSQQDSASVKWLAVHPSGQFLYSIDCDSDGAGSVVVFTLDHGVPAPSVSSLNTQFCPTGFTLDATGRFLYLSSLSEVAGDVEGFSIDPESGALTPLEGSPFDTHLAVALTRSRDHVYVGDQAGLLHTYRIDAETGALVSFQPVDLDVRTHDTPVSILGDHEGQWLFIANSRSGTISMYALGPELGDPFEVEGSPFAAGNAPALLAVDPFDGFLYVSNPDSDAVRAFAIRPGGLIEQVPGSPFSTGKSPTAAVAVPFNATLLNQ
jgi:6-phosphogluconolactonase